MADTTRAKKSSSLERVCIGMPDKNGSSFPSNIHHCFTVNLSRGLRQTHCHVARGVCMSTCTGRSQQHGSVKSFPAEQLLEPLQVSSQQHRWMHLLTSRSSPCAAFNRSTICRWCVVSFCSGAGPLRRHLPSNALRSAPCNSQHILQRNGHQPSVVQNAAVSFLYQAYQRVH